MTREMLRLYWERKMQAMFELLEKDVWGAWPDVEIVGCNFGAEFTCAQAATGTEGRVCDDIAARQAKGVAKYGQTVAENPLSLREWLQHQYEEMLDAVIYLKRAMEEMD